MAGFLLKEILEATGGELLAGRPGERVCGVSTDTRLVGRRQLFVAIKGPVFDGHDFLSHAVQKGAGALLVHRRDVVFPPGIAVIVVEDTLRALGAIAGYHRRKFNIPLVGITGSAGKTSTKELVAAVLRRRYRVLCNKGTENNHVGVPLTLLKLTRRHEAAVIEMGTNHPGEIAFLAQHVAPTVAVFTNVGASHLEGLKNLGGVFREKLSMLKFVPGNGHVIFNADDPYWGRLVKTHLPQTRISYGVLCPADVRARGVTYAPSGAGFRVGRKAAFSIKIPSAGFVYNALAAIACGRLLKVADPQIARALAGARPVKGRQCLARIKGVMLVDDTYNANPVSYANALTALMALKGRGRIVLVAADMLELGRGASRLHRDIGVQAARAGVHAVFAFGEMGKLIASGAKAVSTGLTARLFDDQLSLTEALKEYLKPGDVVLFKGSRGMRMEKVCTDIKDFLKG